MGRPEKYGEMTKVIGFAVPLSKLEEIKKEIVDNVLSKYLVKAEGDIADADAGL